jgi:hypothetical protein
VKNGDPIQADLARQNDSSAAVARLARALAVTAAFLSPAAAQTPSPDKPLPNTTSFFSSLTAGKTSRRWSSASPTMC